MAAGPFMPPRWMNVTIAFIAGADRWRVDLRVLRDGGSQAQVMPLISAPVGLPVSFLQMAELDEAIRNYVEVAIAQIIDPL